MRKKIVCIFLGVACILSLTGCDVGGEQRETRSDTDYRILLNNGSVSVYEFKDADTGVWYLCNDGGITPKLNEDGSLYMEDK